jgi:hypothetical protein
MAIFLSILLSWNGDSLVHTFAVVIVNVIVTQITVSNADGLLQPFLPRSQPFR